jgi:PAS domain S-box-containing protein
MSEQMPRSADTFVSTIKGEMAGRVARHDWAATPLGAIELWPQSLKTAASIVLLSPVPIVMLWGEDGIMIYNDAYAVFAGGRHPQLLGSKVREGWPEVADFNDNVMNVGLGGGTLAYRDRELTLYRTGKPEQVWLNLDYSPIIDESGKPAGVLAIVVETTHRVRADAALRRSEERLRLATENAEIGLWDVDAEDNITFVYPGGTFSMPQDRKTSLDEFFAHLHPDDAPIVRSAYADARDPTLRGPVDVEYRTRAVGEIPARWVAVKGRGIFDDAGRCTRLSGTAIDITKRKQAEVALRQGDEQLRLATEHAEVGLWDVDNLTGTLYWPPRVKAMFGISPDKPVSMTDDFYAGLHPDDRARVSAAYVAASDPAQRALYDVEYRTIGKEDGIVRWVHAKGRGIFDASGRCVRVIGTAMDITESRKIAEALRQSEEKLRLATESAEIGLWDMDVQNSRNHPDARIKAMFGLPPDAEQTADDYFAQVHPDDLERVLAAYAAAYNPLQRALYDVEYRVHGKDGMTRWVAAKGRGQFDAEGRCIRIIGTAMDITARKRVEEEIRELNETLERRVAERTAALERSEAQIRKAEQALQQAQKMEAIGNLTGGIAHDFNNLLQGVAGSLDLIRRRPEDVERVRRWAEAGLQAAERGAKLTSQLLAFSRSQRLEVRPVDISALITGMGDLLSRTLGPTISVALDLDSRGGNAIGDDTQVELAVLNLAINARDAMPDGGTLSITTRRYRNAADSQLPPGDYIEICVEDTGPGMTPEIAARAFDPFFTTKGVGKGTGLGLSQVYAMARQAGGIARIRSRPEGGTAVSIFLPRTLAEAQSDAARPDSAEQFSAPSASILVIDDDQDVRRFLTDSLDSFGYAVFQAEDGTAGLDALSRLSPDLIILDYAMPGMTGAEVAQKVRLRAPNLPIIFASGHADTSALDAVMHHNSIVLRKPFRVEALQEAILAALQRQPRRSQAELIARSARDDQKFF